MWTLFRDIVLSVKHILETVSTNFLAHVWLKCDRSDTMETASLDIQISQPGVWNMVAERGQPLKVAVYNTAYAARLPIVIT